MEDSFFRRHGISVDDFKHISSPSYNTDYHNKPIPILMQPRIAEELIQKIDDYNLKNGTSYGFNIASILSLQQMKKKNKDDGKYKEQFQLENTSHGVEYLKSIFEMIISSNPMEKCIMKEVENTQSHYNSRKSDVDNPKLILMFLPLNGNIDKLQNTMIKFLKKHNLWTDYYVTYSNSKSKYDEDEKEYKKFVDKQIEITKSRKKKGCILLLGHQGKMAYTYLLCDLVIRLDNGTDIDDAEQVGYRCLTEGPITDNVDGQKTIGIIVDLNIQRVYSVMRNKIKEYKKDNPNSNKTWGDIIQYKYTENQFIFNPNEFDFGNCTDEMIEYYKKYSKDLESKTLIDTVTCNILCDDTLCDIIKKIKLKDGTYQANPKLNGKQPEVTKGDKTKKKGDPIEGDDNTSNSVEPQNEDSEPEIDVFKNINKTKNLYEFLSKLSCLILRLDYKNPNITSNVIDLLKTLRENEKRFNIIKMKLIDDYDISGNDLNIIYDKYIIDMNNQNNIDILDDIFEIYSNSDPKVVRDIIGRHFIPSLDQKKKNAEIPTPPKLCDEMISKIPKEYFTDKNNRSFEPCCGKGNFVLAIFEAYFEGLSHIEDECERSIHILKECLYFCDIDPLNIYITEELLKCHALSKMKEEYWKDWDNVLKIYDVKLNIYIGDTLQLNPKKEWGVEGFNAVIGNPPYNKGKNANFYVKFMEFSLNNLKDNGYNLFVIPNRFLIPKHQANKMISKFQVNYICHTVNDFNVSTDIGYYLATKINQINNTNIRCLFNNSIVENINLDIPTPTTSNSLEYKKLSDKILMKGPKITFIKDKKENLDDNHIFIPRHWTRYSSSKSNGGKHVFNLIDEFGDDGRYVKITPENKENVKWYLNRSKIIRFITNNYASTVYIPPFIWENIPLINFNTKYNNSKLYEMFDLSEGQIQLIESIVD